jgi:hypothetical protein
MQTVFELVGYKVYQTKAARVLATSSRTWVEFSSTMLEALQFPANLESPRSPCRAFFTTIELAKAAAVRKLAYDIEVLSTKIKANENRMLQLPALIEATDSADVFERPALIQELASLPITIAWNKTELKQLQNITL